MEELLVEMPGNLENLALPDPALVTYYRNLEDRTFWISGDIDAGILEIVKNIIMINQRDEHNHVAVEQRTPIKIFLFTDGGEVDSTFSLIDTIAASKTPVITVNAGAAMSCGFLIFVAGHKRYTYKYADAMYHSGSAKMLGDFEKIESSMENYKQTVKRMQDHVLQRTRIPSDEFDRNKMNDWYFSAEEMLKYGIADAIVEDVCCIGM